MNWIEFKTKYCKDKNKLLFIISALIVAAALAIYPNISIKNQENLQTSQDAILNVMLENQKLIKQNQQVLKNTTNETKQLVKIIVSGFGPDSGYADRENFQYKQANETFAFIKENMAHQDTELNEHGTLLQKLNQLLNRTK